MSLSLKYLLSHIAESIKRLSVINMLSLIQKRKISGYRCQHGEMDDFVEVVPH